MWYFCDTLWWMGRKQVSSEFLCGVFPSRPPPVLLTSTTSIIRKKYICDIVLLLSSICSSIVFFFILLFFLPLPPNIKLTTKFLPHMKRSQRQEYFAGFLNVCHRVWNAHTGQPLSIDQRCCGLCCPFS